MSSFITRNKQDWEELENLVRRGGRWGNRLSAADRDRLDQLYRRTTLQLARVATKTDDESLIRYLNQLTAAAHSLIYLPPNKSAPRKLVGFFTTDFPRAIARHWRQHLLSATLVVCGALLGYFAANSDPVLAHALWPAEDPRQPGSTPEQLLSHLREGRDESQGGKFFFASFLFQHNLKVGILAMVTGFLASIPTLFLLLLNGMLLGVFVAIHHQAGITSEMWAWILPHGITEMGAIILCGGVGLMLGTAGVRPGALSRAQSLKLAGRESARICLGAAAMLALAAVIESYVRQSHWSTSMRLLFAGGTALFWIFYIGYGVWLERRAAYNVVYAASDSHGSLK